MIAVAKGLLGGLETSAASPAKKDGSTPPFADTFQQISADQVDQATRAVGQRLASASRASSGGKKVSGSSSIVDATEQAASVSGGSASAAKAEGKSLASVATNVLEGDAESSSEQALPVGTGKITGAVEVAEGQVGGAVSQGKTGASAVAPSLVGSAVAQTANGTDRDGTLSSSLPSTGDGSQSVATSSVKGFVSGAETESNAVGGSASSASLPIVQQISSGSGLQSLEVSFAGKQTDAAFDQNTAAATGFNPSKTVAGKILQAESTDSSPSDGQTSTPILLAPVSAEGLVADATISGQSRVGSVVADAVRAPVIETQLGRNESGRSAAPAGNIPEHGTSGSLQSVASGQSTKSVSGATSTKTFAYDSEEEANGQTRNPTESIAASSQSAQAFAAGPMDTSVSGQGTLQRAVPKIDTIEMANIPNSGQVRANEASSSVAAAGRASVGSTAQRLEIAPTAEAPKTTAKATQGKAPRAESSEVVATANVTVAMETPASHVASAQPAASVANASDSQASAFAALAPGLASGPARSSNALHGETSSAARIASTANRIASPSSAPGYVTPAVAGSASALKGTTVDSDESRVSIVDPEGALSEATQGTNYAPGMTAGDGSIGKEAIVAAASSLVKNGPQRGAASGDTAVVKERKTTAAEGKPAAAPASSTLVEAGPIASGVSPSGAASTAMKSATGEHQTAPVSGGQPSVAPVGNVEGTGLAVQSQGTAAAGSIMPAAPQAASALVTSDASTGGSNGVGVTSPASLQGADHALSPLAHTTLSASPTVLEIGVPGGTQGWLKIRAEIGEGGVVQASMSASTHAGQDALHRDLPAMTAFLASERVPVNLQVTHGASAGAGSLADANGSLKDAGFNLGSSLGQSLNQNANSSAGSGQGGTSSGTLAGGASGGQDSGPQREAAGRASDSGSGSAPTRAGAGVADADWSAPVGYGSGLTLNGGSWLNVIA